MADLNPNPTSPSPPQPDGFPLESDDISTLLQTLLQSSTLPSSSSASLHTSQHHHQQSAFAAAEEFRPQFGGSAAFSDSSSGLDFPFRGDCYAPGESERSRSAFSGAIGEGIGEFDCETEKDQDASDVQRNSGPSRSSAKRTRGAEFHNLSEKRRRQRINEKMKALQKLIPNSNKTDKASMLDEAIEYLKQLQLQVQMLALRNGSTLQPFYIPGVMHSAQPAAAGIYFNGGEGMPGSSRGVGSLTAEQELPVQTVYNASSRCASSDQKIVMPSALEHGNLEYSLALEPSSSNHCRPFNLRMPSKEVYGGSKLPQLQLDAGCCRDESSSGVSS